MGFDMIPVNYDRHQISQLSVTRFVMKLFKSTNTSIINDYYLPKISLPCVLLQERREKLLRKLLVVTIYVGNYLAWLHNNWG